MKARIGLILLLATLITCLLPGSALAWTKEPPVSGDFVTGVTADGQPYVGVTWDTAAGKPTSVELQAPGIGIVDREYKIQGKDLQAGIKYLYLPVGFQGEIAWCLYGRYGATPYIYYTF